MAHRNIGNQHAAGNQWTSNRYVPSVREAFPVLDPQGFAFVSRVKALHHWIRKGDARKAAVAATVAFHQANKILDRLDR